MYVLVNNFPMFWRQQKTYSLGLLYGYLPFALMEKLRAAGNCLTASACKSILDIFWQMRLKGIEVHFRIQMESVRVLQSPPKERMLTRGAGYSDCSLCEKGNWYVLAASSRTWKTLVQVSAYQVSGESIICQWEHWEEQLFVDFNLQLGSQASG